MKIAILLGDGMSGEPLADMGGKTTLELASTPEMDRLSREGTLGLAHTIPKGYPAGSDVANLSVFGYDPAKCYTGRSPLEAAAMGVELGDDDVAFRMNLVTLLAGIREVYMDDFNAGHISTEEAAELINHLGEEMGSEEFEFHPGVSYRHLLCWRGGVDGAELAPPHDISGQPIHEHLPKGPGANELLGLITGSQILLKNHPINEARRAAGKKEANSIWLWGQGKRPRMATYDDKFGLTGSVICAVDLIKGIGLLAGLECPHVEGATGYIDTDYDAKAQAALDALDRGDFVYVHVEAPDEAGHSGDAKEKIKAIERFDEAVVGKVRRGLEEKGEPFAILVMPDHPTPVALKTHTHDPVPFIVFDSEKAGSGEGGKGGECYSEAAAKATGVEVADGYKLMEHLTGKVQLW